MNKKDILIEDTDKNKSRIRISHLFRYCS
jgi:hypothetical protein